MNFFLKTCYLHNWHLLSVFSTLDEIRLFIPQFAFWESLSRYF